jgi:hypothetical protein
MAAEVIRDVVIRVTVQSDKAKLDVPDMSAAKKAVQDTQRELEKAAEQGAKAVVEETEAVEELEEALADTGVAATSLRNDVGDAARSIGDDLEKAGQAAFTLARGVALAASTTEEDLGKAVRVIAAAQAGFDVFTGTLGGLSAGINILNTLNSTATVTAVVNESLAAANTKVAASGAAAATSMTALNASTGGVLLVVGALVAGIATLALAFTNMGDEGEEATDKINDGFDATIARLEKAVSISRAVRDEFDELAVSGAQREKQIATTSAGRLTAQRGIVSAISGRVTQAEEAITSGSRFIGQDVPLSVTMREAQEKQSRLLSLRESQFSAVSTLRQEEAAEDESLARTIREAQARRAKAETTLTTIRENQKAAATARWALGPLAPEGPEVELKARRDREALAAAEREHQQAVAAGASALGMAGDRLGPANASTLAEAQRMLASERAAADSEREALLRTISGEITRLQASQLEDRVTLRRLEESEQAAQE